MACLRCGLDHRGWITCAKAKHDLPSIQVAKPEVVVATPEVVVATEDAVVATAAPTETRHGKYKDAEARKQRMRDYMRKRRSAAA